MKYCSQCGKELVDEAVVCPNCGCAVQTPVSQQEEKPSTCPNCGCAVQTPVSQQEDKPSTGLNCGCAVQTPVSQQEEKPSTGLNILAFLFPLIGLILFLCFQKTTPVRAKAIGKWALIGFIVGVALSVLRVLFA